MKSSGGQESDARAPNRHREQWPDSFWFIAGDAWTSRFQDFSARHGIPCLPLTKTPPDKTLLLPVFLDVESLLDARNDAERLEALKALEKAYDISWTGRTGKPFALVIPFVSSRAAKDQALARLKELESLTALQIAIWQVPKGKEREVVYAEQVSSALEHVLMLYGGGIRNKWLPRLMNLTFAPGQFIKCFDFLGYLVFLVPLVVLWPAPPWLAKIYYAICLATSGNLLLPAISRSRKPTTHREVSLCWQVWYLLSLAGCAIAALVCWLPEVISTLVSGSLLLECVTLRQGVFFLRHKFAEAVFATTGTTSRDDDTLRLLHEDARCSPITRTEPVSLNWNKVFLSHRNAGRGLVLTHLIDQHLQASGAFPTFVDFRSHPPGSGCHRFLVHSQSAGFLSWF
jgi:hypothetical protein